MKKNNILLKPSVVIYAIFCIISQVVSAFIATPKYLAHDFSTIVWVVLIGTLMGILLFFVSLAPAFLFRLIPYDKKINDKNFWFYILFMIIYFIYLCLLTVVLVEGLGMPLRDAVGNKLGLSDLWAIWLWMDIINYGKRDIQRKDKIKNE